MNSIPIQLLNALYTFSQSANLKEAAIKIGISQPGLSKQLRLLENQLPQACFAMEGKRFSPDTAKPWFMNLNIALKAFLKG